MSMTDPISDLLTRIRNAILAKHDRLDVPTSKLKRNMCVLLKSEGFIQDYEVIENQPQDTLRIYLRYSPEGIPAVRRLARVSKPGRRVYRGADDIKPVLNGLGVAIVSTSHGLLTDKQARADCGQHGTQPAIGTTQLISSTGKLLCLALGLASGSIKPFQASLATGNIRAINRQYETRCFCHAMPSL